MSVLGRLAPEGPAALNRRRGRLAQLVRASRLHREGREFESLAAYHSTQRQPQRVIRDITCAAISLAQCHLPLLQKPQKSPAGPGAQFLGIQRPVIVPVGRFETLRDDGKVFFLRQRSVMIGVGGGEFRR
jgi:hypothetical protein